VLKKKAHWVARV